MKQSNKYLFAVYLSFFCFFTSCFKEPNKDFSLKTQNQELNNSINEKIETDTLNNIDEEVENNLSNRTNSDDLNFEIKDLIKQLNFILSKSEYYGTTIKIFDLERGILKFGNYKFKVHEIVFYYLDQDKFDGFGRHHLVIECGFGESCILITYNNASALSITTPFDSKENCEEAIEIFDKIKEAYYKK